MDRIQALAAEIEAIRDDRQLPVALQRLNSTLRGSPSLLLLQAVWDSGLVYVMVDCLGMDYSGIQGKWETAAGVAGLLATCSRGAPPEEFSKFSVPHKFLSLAWRVSSAPSTGHHAVDGMVSRRILEALLGVCEAHPQLFCETWADPILLTILLMEDPMYRRNVISFLCRLLDMHKSSVPRLPEEETTHIAQELAFNIVQTSDAVVAEDAVRSLLRVATAHARIVQDLATYEGLVQALAKWERQPFWGFVKQLIDAMGTAKQRSAVESLSARRNRAATSIQAAWRATVVRTRLEALNRGVVAFQQSARVYLARKRYSAEQQRQRALTAERQKQARQLSHINRRERIKALVKDQPAEEVEAFLAQQQNDAAVTIQTAWRGKQGRRQLEALKAEARRLRAVITIQKYFRGFKARKTLAGDRRARKFPDPLFPSTLTDQQRIGYQKAVATYRETHARENVPLSEVRELYHEAHALLLDHVQNHRRKDARLMTERDNLITRLRIDSEALREAPSLGQAPPQPDLISSLLSSAPDIVREGRRRHQEQLRSLRAPWWKSVESANKTATPVHDIFFPNQSLLQ